MSGVPFIFLGQNEMGGAALRQLVAAGRTPGLVLTRPDKPHVNAVTVFALEHGLGHLLRRTPTLNTASVTAALTDLRPAIAFCCGWPERLSPELLHIPARGWVNLHPSSLPAWRGSDPIGWQLLGGTSRLVCSAHRMVPAIDAGPIVATESFAVETGVDGLTARRRAGQTLGRLMCRLLEAVDRREDFNEFPQDTRWETRCPPAGIHVLLDTTRLRCAQAIRAVRAFAPYPGVAVYGLSTLLRAITADAAGPLGSLDTAGMVRHRDDDSQRPEVACVDGWLRLGCRRS